MSCAGNFKKKVEMNDGIWDTLLTIIVTAAVILIPITCFQVTNDAIPPTCKHLAKIITLFIHNHK